MVVGILGHKRHVAIIKIASFFNLTTMFTVHCISETINTLWQHIFTICHFVLQYQWGSIELVVFTPQNILFLVRSFSANVLEWVVGIVTSPLLGLCQACLFWNFYGFLCSFFACHLQHAGFQVSQHIKRAVRQNMVRRSAMASLNGLCCKD